MKKRLTFITVLFVLFFNFIFSIIQAQTHAEQNLQKYWVYRERLKNYMVNGTEQGNSIPAGGRNAFDGKQMLHWNDSPWDISYWMGTLAMEYDLLVRAKAPASQLSQTLNDLYNVIEAVNRLDLTAEGYWNGNNSLNGFSVPDDIPDNFGNRPNADALNDSWVPPPDWFRAKCMDGAPQVYKPNREVSADHVAGMFIGLSLVKKFIPASLTLNNGKTFADYPGSNPTNNYVIEVQNIAKRFIDWMQSSFPHEWKLQNPIENRAVLGVCNEMEPNPCTGPPKFDKDWKTPTNHCRQEDWALIGNTSGSYGKNGAIGFLAANMYIQGNSPSSLAAFIEACENPVLLAEWNTQFILPKKHQRWPLGLVALGGIYHTVDHGNTSTFVSTKKQVAKALVHSGAIHNWEHLILLNRLLHGTHNYIIPNNFYECLLDNAPCRGYDSEALTGFNTEWAMGHRVDGDRGKPDGGAGSNSGLSYLFYFNLYNEIVYLEHEEKMTYSSDYYGLFKQLNIKNLALKDIEKKEYTELDKKNFMASNSITAQENYFIASYDFENEGRVTMVAGNTIDLLPGFAIFNANNVLYGASFNTYLDPTIKPMTCINPTLADALIGCARFTENLRQAQDTIHEYDTLFVAQNPQVDSIEISQNLIKNIEILILPNPSTGLFTCLSKYPLQNIEVRDVLGNLVYSKNFNNMVIHIDIDISSQSRGIYFLKAQSADKISIKKVILR